MCTRWEVCSNPYRTLALSSSPPYTTLFMSFLGNIDMCRSTQTHTHQGNEGVRMRQSHATMCILKTTRMSGTHLANASSFNQQNLCGILWEPSRSY